MAIAHVCIGCGLDLARHRAVLERRYHLPIVTCSRCGCCEVRRRHPIQQGWRTFLRVKKAVIIIIAQVIALLLLTALTLVVAYGLADLLVDFRLPLRMDGVETAIAIIGLILLPVATGAWLGSTFSHWPRKSQWLGWAALVLFVGFVVPGMDLVLYRLEHGPTGWLGWSEAARALIIFAFMWCVSFAGLPLAQLCRSAARVSAWQRWRRRRARLRKRRTGS